MFNKIFINKTNLLHNVHYLQNLLEEKKLCVMVKANAYGHGMKEIVQCLEGEDLSYGVSNEEEAFALRELSDKQIIVFGAIENYQKVMSENIDFALFSLEEAKKVCKIAKKFDLKPKMHLCLNSGMNRYGIKDKNEFLKIISILQKYNFALEGFYTHFSSLTTDENYTERQKRFFYEFCFMLPKEWKLTTHVGGGRSIFLDIDAQMFRSGIEVYGYGDQNLLPVMSVKSQIVDITQAEEGEHIGYLCGYTASKNMRVGVVPLGYADGLPRKLSNKLIVKCKGRPLENVGNICMDCFMVDLGKNKVKVGDEVEILLSATDLAPLIESTEYEVLTNFSRFRGERIILEN